MTRAWALAYDSARTALWCVPVVLTINNCLVGTARVQGRSMRPTLNPEGSTSWDRILAEKWSIRFNKYNRGDVVLLRSPEHPRALMVKRLVGLEGDWVAVPGQVEIKKIPKGHCWVEGDNAALSEDSRTKFGAVPLALIEGHVKCIFWPLSRMGWVENHVPKGRLLVIRPEDP